MLKKIIYISYDLEFLSIHAHEIILNLIKSGCKVSLFIPNDVYHYFELHKDCKVHAVPVIFQCKFIRTIIFPLILTCILIADIFRTNKPALIYARQNYMGLPVILLACLLKIPYFAEVNGLIVAGSGKATQKLKHFSKTWLESRILHLSGAVIVPSNALKKRMMDRYRIPSEKIYAIPNGFNELIFNPRETRTMMCRKIEFKKNDFVVGFIGSMGEWQGIEVLKKAIEKTFLVDTSIKFLLVGDYSPDSSIKKIRFASADGARNITDFIKTKGYEGNIIYHRFVKYESSADFMNCCDVLIAPYTTAYKEFGGGSPMKLYAYLACAKPVIISNLGEWTDSLALLKHNAAYLIPPNDSQALVKAIIELKNNEDLRKKMGQNGRYFALKERRWSHSSAKIMNIYNRKFNRLRSISK